MQRKWEVGIYEQLVSRCRAGMERKGGMTHGRRKSGGSPSKWQQLSSSLQSPSWTLYWSRTTACFYSCISKNFTRLYLFACWYLASFLRDNHITDHGPPSCWNSSASPSPHSPSSRIGPPRQTSLNSPSTSPFTVRCTPSQSDHPQPQKSAAAGSRPGRNATRNFQDQRVSHLHDSATS